MQSVSLALFGLCLFVVSTINGYAENVCPTGQNSEVLCNGAYYGCGNSNTHNCNGVNLSCSCRSQPQ